MRAYVCVCVRVYVCVCMCMCVSIGEWQFDLWCGQGQLRWPNDDMYTGAFLNGLVHGAGKKLFSSGCRYEGMFEHGLRHGAGCLITPCASVLHEYEGDWQFDQRSGNGKWTVRTATIDDDDASVDRYDFIEVCACVRACVCPFLHVVSACLLRCGEPISGIISKSTQSLGAGGGGGGVGHWVIRKPIESSFQDSS